MLHVFREMSKEEMYRMVHSVYIEVCYENAREKYPKQEDLSEAIKEEFYFVEKFLGKFMSKNENTYYVLEEDGEWVSALRLTKIDDYYYMEALETAPKHRKKGYASKLIREVIELLGEKVVLRSNVRKTNVASLETHRKCGFVIEEENGTNAISGVQSDKLYGMLYLGAFDYDEEAVINPWDIYKPVEGMPKVLVSCFARTTFKRMLDMFQSVEIIALAHDAANEYPVYKVNYEGTEMALMNMPVGASTAAGCLEDIFTFGVERVVLFGTCGVLDSKIKDCSVIIPNRAVRDEGVSWHYAPPSNEIVVNAGIKDDFIEFLKEIGCHYTEGKVWTTDAFYRETKQKVERRKSMGCIAVDMECASLAAVSQFRKKQLMHFFYAADVVDKERWERRSLSNNAALDEKDKIAWLALEFGKRMSCSEEW